MTVDPGGGGVRHYLHDVGSFGETAHRPRLQAVRVPGTLAQREVGGEVVFHVELGFAGGLARVEDCQERGGHGGGGRVGEWSRDD